MNVHKMWSEEELDRALGVLNAEVPPGDKALATARAELMTAAGAPEPEQRKAKWQKTRRHWGHWVAAVAIVAALVTTLLVVPFGKEPPAVSAGELLARAAEKIGASDPVVKPGQYLYLEEHTRGMLASTDTYANFSEFIHRTWIPADPTQEWLKRTREIGRRTRVDRTTEVPDPAPSLWTNEADRRAKCGDFDLDPGEQPCRRKGTWYHPNREFLAALPTDPQQLYDRIRKDVGEQPPGVDLDQQVFALAGYLLKSGVAPAAIRANLYRALALLPGLKITDQNANLAGLKGTGFGLERDGHRYEMIIDPVSGQFIGERATSVEATPIFAPGTVTSFTSMKIGVADKMGDEPGR